MSDTAAYRIFSTAMEPSSETLQRRTPSDNRFRDNSWCRNGNSPARTKTRKILPLSWTLQASTIHCSILSIAGQLWQGLNSTRWLACLETPSPFTIKLPSFPHWEKEYGTRLASAKDRACVKNINVVEQPHETCQLHTFTHVEAWYISVMIVFSECVHIHTADGHNPAPVRMIHD